MLEVSEPKSSVAALAERRFHPPNEAERGRTAPLPRGPRRLATPAQPPFSAHSPLFSDACLSTLAFPTLLTTKQSWGERSPQASRWS